MIVFSEENVFKSFKAGSCAPVEIMWSLLPRAGQPAHSGIHHFLPGRVWQRLTLTDFNLLPFWLGPSMPPSTSQPQSQRFKVISGRLRQALKCLKCFPLGLFLTSFPSGAQMVRSGPEEEEWLGKGEIFNNDFINTIPSMTSTTGLYSSITALDLCDSHNFWI